MPSGLILYYSLTNTTARVAQSIAEGLIKAGYQTELCNIKNEPCPDLDKYDLIGFGTPEPVYLTKNGEGDLVVMDIEAFARRESMLRLRENLIVAEEGRLSGKSGYTIDKVSEMMKAAVREVLDGQRK